jgi:REP element-mobilizing transposase RayT
MVYVPRFEYPGATFHVTSHAVGDEPLYRDIDDRDHFNRILGYTADRLGVRVLMWCQMTDHHHLLLETPDANLGRALHRINGIYARGFNERHRRRGHLFRERYRCWFIQSESHFFDTVRYIALNPVKAGLCGRPERYRWCSYGRMIRSARPWPANGAADVVSRCGGVETIVAYVDEGLRALELERALELAA